MVSVLRIFFHPLILPVRFSRFGRRAVATRYSTLRAACSVGKWPRWRTALRNLAFNDSIALVVYTIRRSSSAGLDILAEGDFPADGNPSGAAGTHSRGRVYRSSAVPELVCMQVASAGDRGSETCVQGATLGANGIGVLEVDELTGTAEAWGYVPGAVARSGLASLHTPSGSAAPVQQGFYRIRLSAGDNEVVLKEPGSKVSRSIRLR
jgi:hypothetical protein